MSIDKTLKDKSFLGSSVVFSGGKEVLRPQCEDLWLSAFQVDIVLLVEHSGQG